MPHLLRTRFGCTTIRYVITALLGLFLPLASKAQDGLDEQTAISGNQAVIVVTVRDASGSPIAVPAVVKLYRGGGIPNGQSTTAKGGRAIFTPQNLGQFSVVVEAPGYKTGHEEVSVPIPVKAEVDVYLQPEANGVDVKPAGGPVLAPKAKEALDKGLQSLRENKLDDADKHLQTALRLAPSHPDVLYLQAVLLMKRSTWTEAQAVLEKATQLDPNHPRALAALGTALANQGKYQAAIAPLEKSLQLAPGAWETHWTLARAYYYQKQYDLALGTSQLALTQSAGKAPEIQLLVAQSLTAVGRYEDSANALRDFMKNHPDHPDAPTARRWLERLKQSGKIQ